MKCSYDLRSYQDKRWLARYKAYLPQARTKMALPTRTAFGVDASTIRAISTGVRGREHGPLAVYEEWAGRQWKQLLQEKRQWSSFNTPEGFERLHRRLTRSLGKHWSTRMRKICVLPAADERKTSRPVSQMLSLAHTNKLVDLFVRWLAKQHKAAPLLAQAALSRGHMPLDRKSLQVTSEMYSRIGMSRSFSMGDVETEAQYWYWQSLARLACDKAGGSPLLLDFFALNHPAAQALYAKPKEPRARPATGLKRA